MCVCEVYSIVAGARLIAHRNEHEHDEKKESFDFVAALFVFIKAENNNHK